MNLYRKGNYNHGRYHRQEYGFDEYVAVIGALEEAPVAAYEVNISCPNVDAGGMTMGCHVPALRRWCHCAAPPRSARSS